MTTQTATDKIGGRSERTRSGLRNGSVAKVRRTRANLLIAAGGEQVRSKVRILLCTTVIAVVALTAHILVQDATRLPIGELVIGCSSGGPYSGSVTLVAYLTAWISTFVAAVLYF